MLVRLNFLNCCCATEAVLEHPSSVIISLCGLLRLIAAVANPREVPISNKVLVFR